MQSSPERPELRGARPPLAQDDLLDSLPAAVYTCDAQGRITYYNRAAAELWGREPEIGKDLWCGSWRIKELDGTPVPLDACPMAEALRSGAPVVGRSLVIVRPDGSERQVAVYPQPILDKSGNVVGATNLLADISERVRAEAAQRHSELTLSGLISILPVGVASCDTRGRITYFNDEAAKLLGKRAPIGGDLFGFLCPLQIESRDGGPIALTPEALAEALRSGVSLRDLEIFAARPDGGRAALSASVDCLREMDGEVYGAVAVFQDISQREQAQRDARHLAAIVESSEDAIVSKDLNGVITSWNRGAERLFGYTPDEAIGQSITMLIPPDRHDEEPGILGRIRRGERVEHYETVRRTKDGELIDISVTISPIKDDRDRIVGASKIARDIRRIKEFERRLKREDRRKDEFLATLAHELRNPLAPLRNGIEVLRRVGDPGAQAAEAREMMDRQLGQMVRLIDDLLDASRITRGKFQLRLASVDLVEVMRSAVESCRPLADASRHALTVDLPDAPIHAMADAARISQILVNLVSNAVKYTPPGGRIQVSARQEDRRMLIEIRDNGVGIAKELLSTIFEPFIQGDHSPERNGGGLGLGLTLVKQLVEMHQGSVEARSEGPGRGSVFAVELPLRAAKPAKGKPLAPQRQAGGRRVLVADDNEDAASSLARLLRIMGHEAATAFDGVQAVASAESFLPDVVIMDIGMPRLNGHDAGRLIRQRLGDRPVTLVALTGWGQEADRRLSSEAGFDHHLIKPIDMAELERILRG